jgi:hypothetical protein
MPEVVLRRVLAATVALAGLVSGALLGASPAAADSFGWDSGTRCCTILPTQRDTWSGPTTYTFGPTRLYNARAYIAGSRIQLHTTLSGVSSCDTDNRP